MELVTKLKGVCTKPRTTGTSKRRRTSNLCSCTSRNTATTEFPPIWSELLKNRQLCDGTVICQDKEEFKVHRAILAAVSPYFKVQIRFERRVSSTISFKVHFTNSLNAGRPELTTARVNINSKIFKKILDYAYTGHCLINCETVESLLQAADQYQIMGVIQLCCRYILGDLSIKPIPASNYFFTLRSAEAHELSGDTEVREALLLPGSGGAGQALRAPQFREVDARRERVTAAGA